MLSAHRAWAQTPSGPWALTVDELVSRALTDNPELHAARAEVDAAQGRLRQAGLGPNPMLDLGVQHSVTGPDNNLTVGATVPLDLGGRKAGRVGVAMGVLESKRAQLADRERRLRAEVRMKAGEVLAARRNLQFTAEVLAVNRNALSLVRARVSQGAAPALDERLLYVEVNRLEANRRLLESQVDVLALHLKTLVGLGPEVPLSLQGDLRLPPLRLDLQDGVARALAERTDLLMARAEVDTARAMIRKEQAEGRWDASLNVGYMRQDFGYNLRGLPARGDPQPIQDVFHYVGGGVTIMLPLRNQNQGNIAAALAETTAAEHRRAFVTLSIRQEVIAAFTQYDATQQALALYTQGVRDVAQHNLEVVRQAYALGRTSLLDLIAEQRRYIEIEASYTEFLQQAYNARVAIERVVGTVDR